MSTPGPSDHDVTSLLASTSPGFTVLGTNFLAADMDLLTEFNSRVRRDSHQHVAVGTPSAGCLMTDGGESHIPATGSAGTHNRASVIVTGDLCSALPRRAVVDEDLGIRANTDKVVPGG